MDNLAAIYIVGLIMFGIAVGVYFKSGPVGFMVIGGGLIVMALFAALISFLNPTKMKTKDGEEK